MADGPVEAAFTVYSDFEDYAGGVYSAARTSKWAGTRSASSAGAPTTASTTGRSPTRGTRTGARKATSARGTDECGIESQVTASAGRQVGQEERALNMITSRPENTRPSCRARAGFTPLPSKARQLPPPLCTSRGRLPSSTPPPLPNITRNPDYRPARAAAAPAVAARARPSTGLSSAALTQLVAALLARVAHRGRAIGCAVKNRTRQRVPSSDTNDSAAVDASATGGRRDRVGRAGRPRRRRARRRRTRPPWRPSAAAAQSPRARARAAGSRGRSRAPRPRCAAAAAVAAAAAAAASGSATTRTVAAAWHRAGESTYTTKSPPNLNPSATERRRASARNVACRRAAAAHAREP